jgi:hypothetical protein
VIPTRVLNQTPMTQQEVAALKARAEKLSDQLISANDRRKALEERVRGATGADRAGLEQRIGVLDARLARLESDIDETGRLLASTPAALTTGSQQPFNFGPTSRTTMKEAIPIVAILSVFVFFPIAISIARNIWRRGSVQPSTTGLDRESAQRLERMEQAMDAIAIEIERVSEGQRFVTRLLGDQRGAVPIGAGQSASEQSRAQAEKAGR